MLKLPQLLMGVLVVALLLMLRPPELGGTASYVTVNRTGLEPTLYRSDLTVVKLRGSYQAGDLVAIQTVAGPFFARVTTAEGEGYRVRFPGELESVSVTSEHMLGRLWFNFGALGRGISGMILDYFGLQAEAAR